MLVECFFLTIDIADISVMRSSLYPVANVGKRSE